ncbi:hypothetical protein C2E23DRAFT_469958 [Lenzites betulinus]|nr:hypothetical protein C2E23DRAFT_469958 [Lenzites betulinus]
MSLISSAQRPPTRDLALMLLKGLESPEFAALCASDTSILKLVGEAVTASYTTTRGLRNASRPINRLPPEILIRIFSLVRGQLIYEKQYKKIPIEGMFDVRDLQPLIRTCRHWKTLVTGTPSLWSTISRAQYPFCWLPEQILDRYLKYAVGAEQLYLHIDCRLIPPSMIELCREQGPRVRGIHLECSSSCSGFCYSLLRSSLPNLDFCYLAPRTDCQEKAQSTGLVPKDVARQILPQSSQLRTLVLSGLIPTTAFPALKTLRIDRLDYPRDGQALLSFLAGTPQLQELVLDVEKGLYDADFSHVGRVPLDHLQMLKIQDDTFAAPGQDAHRPLPFDDNRTVRSVLSHVSLPRSRPLCIELSTIPIDAVCALLEDLGSGNMESEVTSMIVKPSVVKISSSSSERIRLAVMLRCANAREIELPFVLTASDSRTDTKQTCESFCNLFTSASTFSSLRGLWLSRNAAWVACASPLRILRSLSQLSILVVDSMETYDDLGIFNPAARDYDPRPILECLMQDAHGTVPCPLLQTLVIYSPQRSNHASFLDKERQLSRSRAEAGNPFTRVIVLADCNATQTLFQRSEAQRAQVYSIASDGDLQLLQEIEGSEAVRQHVEAEWNRLTH